MKQFSLACGFLSLIIASSLSCADQQNTRNSLVASGNVSLSMAALDLTPAPVITVVDENLKPVAGATVLVGYDVGNPFPGNSLVTDANGIATPPANWKAALPVTVQAQGFVSATLPALLPGVTTMQLTKFTGSKALEIRGTTTDFGTLDDQDNVHFGIVVPAIDPTQLLDFEMTTVLSPDVDVISVMGKQIKLPSNLTLPDQTVSLIFPINLNKPLYRAFVRSPGQYLMSATHGNFPLQKVVNAIQAGKSIFEVINNFTFTEGGEVPTKLSGDVSGVDMPVNQVQFKSTAAVTVPTLPADQVVVSIALRTEKDLLMVTDLKRLTSGQSINLVTSATPPSLLSLLMVDANAVPAPSPANALLRPLSLLDAYIRANVPQASKPQNFNQLSFALQSAAGGAKPQFLPLVKPPVLTAGNVLNLDMPTAPAGLVPAGTYLVFSEVITNTNNSISGEMSTHLWEVWSDTWLPQVALPTLNITRNPGSKYRWEVMYLAKPTVTVTAPDEPFRANMKTITHVTRNSVDI